MAGFGRGRFKHFIRIQNAIKFLIIAVLFLSLICLYKVGYLLLHDFTKDPHFFEVQKCPACFGVNLCSQFYNGNITFERHTKYRILDSLNRKNVYYGIINNTEHVVMKKLAHNEELKKLDEKICELAKEPNKKCDVSTNIFKTKYGTAREFNSNLIKGLSYMMACPSQRLVSYAVQKFHEKINDFHLTTEERLHMVTALLVNPEPIFLQTFPPEDGWPFPKYYGACGRFIIEDFSGETLEHYYNSPWEERIDLAYQILLIAQHLTDNKIGFSLYWTDVSFDNFAVTNEGKVVYIDTENVIVVDKAKIKREKKEGWDFPLYSKFDKCDGYGPCTGFSTEKLCTQFVSDHNYYAVCRNILSRHNSRMQGGLLHGLPEDVQKRWVLPELLEECAKPLLLGGRLKVIPQLIDTLKKIRREVF